MSSVDSVYAEVRAADSSSAEGSQKLVGPSPKCEVDSVKVNPGDLCSAEGVRRLGPLAEVGSEA